ncbi:MAG TPA: RidA family protein [Longimicrobiales bacterium]|nr:RidA family protein [Longimicrobiales bacterium]
MYDPLSVRAARRLRRASGFALVLALVGASACEDDDGDEQGAPAMDAAPEVAYLTTPESEAMGFPFSEAVRVGHMLYLSGQVGEVQTAPGEATLVEGGIQAETRQTMENIKAVLERYGSSMDRVVKCTVMIDDMSEWPAMNEVYGPYFPDHKPARSAIGADGLALGAAVEIECWATVG